MEIAVELDDALIGARLFPDGGIGNGELILDADVALLLIVSLSISAWSAFDTSNSEGRCPVTYFLHMARTLCVLW